MAIDKEPDQKLEPGRRPGPRTEEGKTRSSRNSRKHGVLSAKQHFDNEEDYAQFSELLQGLYDSFTPNDKFQEALVEDVAMTLWKLRRLDAWEERCDENWAGKQLCQAVKQLLKQPGISELPLGELVSNDTVKTDAGAWEFKEMLLRMTSDGANGMTNNIDNPIDVSPVLLQPIEIPKRSTNSDSHRLELEIRMGSKIPTILRYRNMLRRNLHQTTELLLRLRALDRGQSPKQNQ